MLALSCAPAGQLSPVQLQKTMFLLSIYYPRDVGKAFYTFRPYNFGPFDEAIYGDMRMLGFERFVRRVAVPGRSWSAYQITDAGTKRAKGLSIIPSRAAMEYLKAVTKWATAVPFAHLLRTIYTKFPEFRKNSVFQE